MSTNHKSFPSIKKGKYRHSKSGNFYEVLGVALHSETTEPLVVYRALYTTEYEFFVRPYEMFIEHVKISGKILPRFEKVDE